MSLSISEAIHQAQEAINGGDYESAAVTCGHLVAQFPGYAAARRLLGEAYREQGQMPNAEREFSEALARNPRHPGAYLGLGLIAEDQGATDDALAFCQVAWELGPQQPHLREPLIRVAMRRFGSDGDLTLSRASLAQLHTNASRPRRAIDEFRRALAQLPGRVDLQLGLAENLWRIGQNVEAARLCRDVLERQPEAVQALAILADIEHRAGNAEVAEDLRARVRAVDPDGWVVTAMLKLNQRADRDWLALPPEAEPVLAEERSAISERPRIAPAPDFDYQPSRVDAPLATMEDLEPISFEEFGGARPSGDEAVDTADLAGLPEELQPMSFEDFGGTVDSPPLDYSSLDLDTGSMPGDLEFEDFSAEPFDLTTIAPAPESTADDAPPTKDAASTRRLASPQSPAPPTRAAGDQDALGALAASLEEDVADLLARSGEPVAPPAPSGSGYTSVLRSLDDQGHMPFDPRSSGSSDASAPPSSQASAGTSDDRDDEDIRSTPQTDEFGRFSQGWDTMDEELARAAPGPMVSGYTAELRSLDKSGLAPFDIEGVEAEAEEIADVTPFDPFGVDAIPSPLAPSAFGAPTPPAAPVTPAPPQPSSAAVDRLPAPQASTDDDALIGDLQPFAFEEFDDEKRGAASQAVGGAQSQPGQPSWAAGHGLSAIPSDEDLDALLAFDDDLPPDPAVAETSTRVLDALPHDSESETEDSSEATPPSWIPERLETDTPMPGASASFEDLDDDSLFGGVDSLAATRQLGMDSPPVEPAISTPDASTAAAPEPASERSRFTLFDSAPDRLTLGTDLFTRSRQVKDELIAAGVINGKREMIDESTDEDNTKTRRIELDSRSAPEHDNDLDDTFVLDDDAADQYVSAVGATRDTATLRAALAVTPNDDELRWWLAEALRQRGDMDEAYVEYRWLIRNAPHRHDAVTHALTECVEREEAPEMAHRLLGDIYRRRGDIARASSHAAMALQQRRRLARAR